MKNLTQKYVRTHIKYGWSSEDFARDLHISVDSFESQLERLYSSAALPSVKRDLARNASKAEKRAAKEAKRAAETPAHPDSTLVGPVLTALDPEASLVLPSAEEDTSATSSAESEAEVENAAPAPLTPEDLRKEIEKILDFLDVNDKKRKEALASRREARVRLQSIQEAILRLKASLEKLSMDALACMDEIDSSEKDLAFRKEERQLFLEEKERLEAKLQALETVEIYLHADGSLEPEFDVSELEWKVELSQLITGEVDPSLTVADLQQVSKIICHVRSLGETPYLVMAEKEQVQNLLDQLLKK